MPIINYRRVEINQKSGCQLLCNSLSLKSLMYKVLLFYTEHDTNLPMKNNCKPAATVNLTLQIENEELIDNCTT